jgi:hypothetical protein
MQKVGHSGNFIHNTQKLKGNETAQSSQDIMVAFTHEIQQIF